MKFKYFLLWKSFNIINDFGYSLVSDNEDNVFRDQEEDSRRYSLIVVDVIGYFNVFINLDCFIKNISQFASSFVLYFIYFFYLRNVFRIVYSLFEEVLGVNKLRGRRSL